MVKTLSLFTFIVLLVTPLVHAEKRKVASDDMSGKFVNCGEYLKSKQIKSCTELRPAKHCHKDQLVNKGDLWMDENHSTSAGDVFVASGKEEVCLDVLTTFATKNGCCGG